MTQVVPVQIRPSAPNKGFKRAKEVQKPASYQGLAGFLLSNEIQLNTANSVKSMSFMSFAIVVKKRT